MTTTFFHQLHDRNVELFWFGLICLVFSIVSLLLTTTTTVTVLGVNAWFKPFKFAFSTFLLSWAMGWFMAYIPQFNPSIWNKCFIAFLAFEIVYIAIQAGRGQLSHFNLSTPVYSALYSMMAFAASAATLQVAYVAYLFFTQKMEGLPDYYVLSIKWSMILFVIFAFEGFVMGSKLTHTIGGPDGGAGWFLVNWSKTFGDPRIAHFIGMHALQVLPVLSFYLFKNYYATMLAILLYTALSVYVLIVALQGRPLIKG
jgi:hypothetical protein